MGKSRQDTLGLGGTSQDSLTNGCKVSLKSPGSTPESTICSKDMLIYCAYQAAQAAGEVFKRQGKGNLIVTSSVSSTLVNIPQKQAAYNASKAAATHLAKCLAVEWADFARVNCISPGFIMTESQCCPTSSGR